jgi:hypothetical protein
MRNGNPALRAGCIVKEKGCISVYRVFSFFLFSPLLPCVRQCSGKEIQSNAEYWVNPGHDHMTWHWVSSSKNKGEIRSMDTLKYWGSGCENVDDTLLSSDLKRQEKTLFRPKMWIVIGTVGGLARASQLSFSNGTESSKLAQNWHEPYEEKVSHFFKLTGFLRVKTAKVEKHEEKVKFKVKKKSISKKW